MIVIVDEIEKVVQSMQVDGVPYFDFGHRMVVSNNLTEKEKDAVLKFQKYPLIALRQDIPETVVDGVWQFKLNIIIVTMTEKKYTPRERYDNIFKPILYPLYEKFFVYLRRNQFMWPGNQKYPQHTKIDRPYWGIPDNERNTKNIFDDPLDGIELIDLKINKRDKTC